MRLVDYLSSSRTNINCTIEIKPVILKVHLGMAFILTRGFILYIWECKVVQLIEPLLSNTNLEKAQNKEAISTPKARKNIIVKEKNIELLCCLLSTSYWSPCHRQFCSRSSSLAPYATFIQGCYEFRTLRYIYRKLYVAPSYIQTIVQWVE